MASHLQQLLTAGTAAMMRGWGGVGGRRLKWPQTICIIYSHFTNGVKQMVPFDSYWNCKHCNMWKMLRNSKKEKHYFRIEI